MNNDIKHIMRLTLHSNWVRDDYPWQEEYLNTYFDQRYNYIHECLDTIHNSAFEYIRMIHCVMKYSTNYDFDIDLSNPVSTFNIYYYLLAKEILEHDDEIGGIIYNIQRVQKLNYLVPLLLNRLPIHSVQSHICEYLSYEY
jgi:hypothetical protein